MKRYLKTTIGRLRLLALLEGTSLLALVFIAVPAKYLYGNPALVRSMGPVHGILFLLFIFNTLRAGIEQRWHYGRTWRVLLACMIPFGTFYIDKTILSKLHA